MSENMIRVYVANARDLMKCFTTCKTEADFDEVIAHMTTNSDNALAAIQTITHADRQESADLFMAMVQDDRARDTFLAQAFVAQVPTCA